MSIIRYAQNLKTEDIPKTVLKTIVESSGGVGIGGAVSKGFKVIVKEEPKTTGSVLKIAGGLEPLTGFLVLIAILIILVLIIKHFHKKRVIKEW